ncbi:hypothetical protein [Acidianus sp. HS-5]|uniref:hypothetical protein n=1 Tax=Acidianus sp. HS-5 TaxID=2886040 RepID=UPI001F2BD3D6|nr:hypothetical protein [Acidianus sp. HS-5]BDC17567.1 hypothetical protein HS5_04570 [Acidianus sp. HS-5]
MGYSNVEENLRKVVEVIDNLIYRSSSLCITFSDIKRETGFHPQALTNLLKRGKTLGLLAECKELGLGEYGYTVLQDYIIFLEYNVINEIVNVNDKCIIMKHSLRIKEYNNSTLSFKGVIVKLFGDIDLDKPFKYDGKEHKEIYLEKTIDNYYIFHFDTDVEIKPGDTFTYEYEFYLKYFPPLDYFIVEPFSYTMLFNAKTYLTKSDKKVIKSVRLEYLPGVKIVKENQGKTYHEVEIIKIPSFRSIKFWFSM